MDKEAFIKKRLAKKAIEEERRNRPVTYLSKFQKKILKEVENNASYLDDGVRYETIEAAALRSLSDLGLVRLFSSNNGVGASLTDKGKLLLYENSKLRFPIPEDLRWLITTTIAIVALILGIIK